MCMPNTCGTCSGATWIGCGAHIPRVMDPVPETDWCTCEKETDSKYPPGVKRAPRFPQPAVVV